MKKYSYKDVVDEFQKTNYILLSSEDEYKNCATKMRYICKKHMDKGEQSISLNHIKSGRGCYYCGLEKLSAKKQQSKAEFQRKVTAVNENIQVLEYNGMKSPAKFRCLVCDYEWTSNPKSMITNGKLCPNCQKYFKGEYIISQLLDDWGIFFLQQYRFSDCRDKKPLPFDFYLPKYNMCIEFDGEQHYEYKNGWSNLGVIQIHDYIKDKYCVENGVTLIRIPYWEKGNIQVYLHSKLVENKILTNNS